MVPFVNICLMWIFTVLKVVMISEVILEMSYCAIVLKNGQNANYHEAGNK